MPGGLALINGRVLTMDTAHPKARAVAIQQGRIVAVGSDAEVRAAAGDRAEVIDLAGRTTTPGLNDAHCHPMGVGHALADVDASNPPCRSIGEIVSKIAERSAETPAGSWVVARGYDQGRLEERRHPSRADLDSATGEHPVLLLRACHHIGVANSRALDLAGITQSTPDPEGGTIDRDEDGNPTGVVREMALALVREALGEPTEQQISVALELAGKAYLSRGVTSVTEAIVRRAEEVRAYQGLRGKNALPVRTSLMMIIEDTLDQMIELGITTGFGDDMLRIGPAKLFSDGSIGGHTARMREPYEGTSSTYGLWMQEPEEMKRQIRRAHDAGFQVGVHAIGDAAVEVILDAYEEAQSANSRPDPRHRIEHCSIVDPAIIRRIRALGAVPVPGTSFLHFFRESYVQNLGLDRIRYAYGMRTFLEEGVIAAASTDAPVVPLDPMIGVAMMMNRVDIAGVPVWPEESVGLEDALRAYTVNGAYASFEETVKGAITPGMLADIAVFETNIETLSADEIRSVRVDHTILGGDLVYSREDASR